MIKNNPINTDKTTVKRFLLESQLLLNQKVPLSNEDSSTALSMIRKLECIQIDPVSVVEKNHHLVLYARNNQYKTEQLEEIIANGDVFEYIANAACIIPTEDFAIFEPIRDYYRYHVHKNLETILPVMNKVLERLSAESPLPSRAFKSANRVRGYWDNQTATTKETTLALNILFDLGQITVDKRQGNEKFFIPTKMKIPEHIFKRTEEIGDQAAKEALMYKYMRAYRVFDFEDTRLGWYKTTAQDRKELRNTLLKNKEVIPLTIEGVNREYYILNEDREKFEETQSKNENNSNDHSLLFIPPLDNLLWRRSRVKDLFDFDYKWEIYFPESKREYGSYAMPILFGDALIGRMNPKLLQNQNTLSVKLLQLEDDVKIDSILIHHLKEALKNFAEFHNANHVQIEKTIPKRLLKDLKKIMD